MTTKISIIGAGSAVFSLKLIQDICLTPNLAGSTVSFMDIDQSRLDAVYGLCQRYAGEVGATLNLQQTTNRQESLRDAGFVINTALAAGHQRLVEGLEIGRKHHYRFGGSLHIMHDEAFWINFYQLQLFESLIKDMLNLCPQAWLLQVANPVLAGVTYIGRKYPEAKVVGLCHGFGGVYHLADVLGLEREHLTFEIPGVNHFVWLTHCYYKGEDVFPMLERWIEQDAATYWETSAIRSHGLGPKAIDLYRRFGAFPIGDTCTPGGGSWPWWHHQDAETEHRWLEDPADWWERHFTRLEKGMANMKQVTGDTGHKVTDHFPPRMSGEIMVPMIESLVCDIPRVFIANIPNKGDFVPGVPHDVAVEIPTLVSKRGIQGIRTHALPQALLAYLLRDRVAPVNMELAAYEQGDITLLRQLILMDPWSHSEAQVQNLLTDIMALPYHQELRQHYR